MNDFIEFEELLKVEGINFKGFGILPKFVMLDQELSLEAKAIYAYLCSFAGNGDTTFPSRSRILSDLAINKDTYYRHFNTLTQQGYIIVRQTKTENASFGKNIYTILSNPKKFAEYKDEKKESLAYSKIKFSGIKSAGYGLIPKAVMIDPRLQIKAKGIYAYFCSFTGSGNNAFPRLEKIKYHLHLSENTYYKFFNRLQELNYITVEQRRVNGKMSVNDYYLNDMPDIDKTFIHTTKSSILKISDTEKNNDSSPILKISDTEISDTEISDTEISDTNINKLTINSLTNNNLSISPEPATPEPEERVIEYILNSKKLPYKYNADEEAMTIAIRFMMEWNTFFPDGYKDKLLQQTYNLFVNSLISMCCAKAPMLLKGNYVSYVKVIDKINELAVFGDGNIDLSAFSTLAMDNFSKAAIATEIKNPMQYMKACIWDSMQTGNINLYAALKRDGYD